MDTDLDIASYQFHSWARKGISSSITDPDDLGADVSTVMERAGILLPVSVNGNGINKDFAIIGPGDIIGINSDMIIRAEPLNWITDFEPNYLAFLEFYDEDFIWRYTPAAPSTDTDRLRPWLFLLVLKEEEFDRTDRRTPVPSITIKSKDVFPPANETWLWAHVHSDAGIPADQLTNYLQFLISLNEASQANPDQLYCRLMSPRKLEANTAYYAFLIPAFETGRLAGTEQPTGNTHAQMPSWGANGAGGEMPVYYEWYFRTGVNEDFETMVKRLVPRDMDPKVGIRDMDCSAPGFVKSDGSVPFPAPSPAVIGLEGALKAPTTVSTIFPDPPAPNDFQNELQKLVNLPIDIIGTDASGDPVISVPFYGSNHAKTKAIPEPRMEITEPGWLSDLNKDPRTRAAAGMGSLVVQENQENYMRQAWAQVQHIIAANKKIKATVLHMKIAEGFTLKVFNTVQPNVLLSMSRPVLAKIMGSPTTIYQQIQDSQLPAAVFTGAFRKLAAPGRRFSKLAPATFQVSSLVTGLNAGTKTAAPPNLSPKGAVTLKDLAAGIMNKKQAAELTDPSKQLLRLKKVPQRPSFSLALASESTTPPATSTGANNDSVEAGNFRKALGDITQRLAAQTTIKEPVAFNINAAAGKLRTGIDAKLTFPKRLSMTVKFPGTIDLTNPANILPAMAYPDIEEPMYKRLVAISKELLLPNLALVPTNTISILQTNPQFIESYMVGLNHEMGRELLWREYPTDERGSYFRQFWDVSGIVSPGGDPAAGSAATKDITPIDQWTDGSLLGDHNNRLTKNKNQLVLVIRGDLLKKYPRTIIFAQKAIAGSTPGSTIMDPSLSNDDFAKDVLFPLYRADIDPDIKLFGFDLTTAQARGTDLTDGFEDNLGWYFVLMQAPGSPVFGLEPSGDTPSTWDDMAWTDFTTDVSFITAGQKPSPGNILPDEFARWGRGSADMAYILFRKPYMVAVHAKQMLASITG